MAAQTPTKLPTVTLAEVDQHSTAASLWLAINGDVYDCTKLVDYHPGGGNLLLDTGVAGCDATRAFFSLHRHEVLTKYARLKVARLDSTPEYVLPVPGELSVVPYAEPSWLRASFASPYYKPSHFALQKAMRLFFDTEVKAEAREQEESHKRPTLRLVELMGKLNIHAMRLGPGKHLHGLVLPGGVKGEEFDYFHELVVIQELVRINSPGYMAGLQAGMVIGAPPLLNYASDTIRAKYLPDILAGKKFICLAISEAAAGSDVRGIKTTAKRTKDGKYYEVTGSKKWITNGNFADSFMTAVDTGKGLSMLLIERDDNVDTKIIHTAYSHAAGTAQVNFDKVLVPVENLMGVENEGLKVILSNFNHERLVILCRAARAARVIYEETFRWAHLRLVFGKPLIDQPVVRAKFANMISKLDQGQAWLEEVTYQMNHMTYEQQSKLLAGPMALLKVYLTRIGGEIAADSVQIWGGRGITKGGMGVYIEQFQRAYKFDSILGGSEEVMADLGVRQAMRTMPKSAL